MRANISYPIPNTRTAGVLVYIFYLICLLPAGIFAFKRPHYNWDMLPYIALVIKPEHPDIDLVHRLTYKSVKENIPDKEYGFLVSGEYRERMAEDPQQFHSQLPFYIVKPLYIGLVYLFYKSGFSLPASTVLPSITAYLLIGLLLFYWLRKYLKPHYAFPGSLLIMYSSYMISVVRISSPDCLSAFLLFAAAYFIIGKPSPGYMLLFFILAIFTRIDNIVTCIILTSFLAFTDRWQEKISVKRYCFTVSVMIACYFSIAWLATLFNWGLLYYPAFASSLDLAKKFHPAFPYREYGSLMYSKAITGAVFSHLTSFLFLVVLILAPWQATLRKFSFDQLLALLLVLIILIRFILFPDISDRFYTAFYLIILILLVRKISNLTPLLNRTHA